MKIKAIKNYWDSKAVEFRAKCESSCKTGNTLQDDTLRTLEVDAIIKHVLPGTKVLDVGCGNGFSTLKIADYVKCNITGVDYSAEMVNNAKALLRDCYPALKDRVCFVVGNILDKSAIKGCYDIIITERCLINLGTWKNQMLAIDNIAGHLNRNGLFIMLEGFKDNLTGLNKIRLSYGLKPIKVVWHNCFFKKSRFERFVNGKFYIDATDNFGSTYMLLSRTLLHKMQEDKKGCFDKKLDAMAACLPNVGNFNYQQLYVLRKK